MKHDNFYIFHIKVLCNSDGADDDNDNDNDGGGGF